MKGIILAALAAISGVAEATNFAAATDGTFTCSNPTNCSGYVTDNAAYSVDAVNVQQNADGSKHLVVTINGVGYVGDGLPSGNTVTTVLRGSTGAFVNISVTYSSVRTCTGSGRGQHCTTQVHAQFGSFSF